MSFKITKKRKIQAWIDETTRLINITLMGKEIPIDITQLPPQLEKRIAIHTEKQIPFGVLRQALRQEISPETKNRLQKILEDRKDI